MVVMVMTTNRLDRGDILGCHQWLQSDYRDNIQPAEDVKSGKRERGDMYVEVHE
jgi:hypothetical protein